MKAEQRDYILNRYNVHKFDDDSYLLTTEHGSWSLLTGGEYERFRLGQLEEGGNLYEHLKERGLILSEKNVADVVKKHALKNQFLFAGPSLHIITSTRRCNQKCRYCHSEPTNSDGSKFDLDEETGKRIVDFALKANSRMVNFEFQGGEPLLNFETLRKVIDYAMEKGKEEGKEIAFSLVTNLAEIDDRIVEDMKERNVKITTSLDGPKDLHNFNRKYVDGGGTYEDVVENIQKLRDAGVDVNALCTITKKSLNRGKDIVDEYRRLGMKYIWLRPLNRIGFAKENWEEVGYTAEEFIEFYEKTLDYILESPEGLKELYAVLLTKKILGIKDPEMTEMTSPCGAGVSQLLYDHNGNIFTCDEGKIYDEFRLGDVEKSSWRDVMTSETFLSMVDISSKKNYLCNNCEWEPFCAICPVNTYSEQNTVVSELPEDFRCKLNGGLIETIFERLLFDREKRNKLEKWAREEKIFA